MSAAVIGTLALSVGTALAAPVGTSPVWVLSINGQAVAASKDEDALTQLYEDAVDSYRTDSVSTLKVLSAVQIRREESVLVKDAVDTPLSTKSAVLDKLRKQTGAATTTVEAQDTVTYVGTRERSEYIWPAHGNYTGNYGIDTINGARRKHAGIDIAGSAGSDICAARAGTVVYAGWDKGGYGNLVVVEHDNGTHTYYAHNSAICVSVGDTVEQGEKIAEMGSTGRVTGVHCHFELRLGNFEGLYVAATSDPMEYLDLSEL